MASVVPVSGAAQSYVRQGKLLALEQLVKVFENVSHRWDNVRPDYCDQLRRPLCMVLLRNCSTSEVKGFQYAVRLYISIILQRQLRLWMKAELGAFYPLLLLRPIEAGPLEPAILTVVLTALKRLCKEPQMQVDLYINFDCDMHSINLYERTAKALSQLAEFGDPSAAPGQSALVRDAAAACALAMVASLDAWSGPIRDAVEMERLNMEPERAASLDASLSNSGSLKLPDTSEVHHFGAAKAAKNQASVGIELFNRHPIKGIASLVAAGIVQNKPADIARFIRKNRDQLDETQMGEYLGHHDEMPIAVMHAYIDGEQYKSLTIDMALRKLLAGFRLPGEAQKIDRIMEKFAARYVQENPNKFETADDAYMLAFATIMLTTDAHNPMADKKLTKEVFLSMNRKEVEGQGSVLFLPEEELEGIYDRIVANEIDTRNSKPSKKRQAEVAAVHKRLAAAIGLTQLSMPFRSSTLCDRNNAAQVQQLRLIEETKRVVASGVKRGDVWYTGSHAEHASPMLEAVGPHLLRSVASALASAGDRDAAIRAVKALVMCIRLAAMFSLDVLCGQFVGAIAQATGVQSKTALQQANPHCQVLALRALVNLGTNEEAGLLGSSWTIILRTLSSVEALVSEMRRSPQGFQDAPFKGFKLGKLELDFSGLDWQKSGSSGSHTIGRFLSGLGFGTEKGKSGADRSKQEKGGYGFATSRGHSRSHSIGTAVRMWADGEGGAETDHVYVASSTLNGDAVLVFTRALCAVSQEELNPEDDTAPRVFSLRKLVECAYYNLGRIRLVWGRLWAIISAHLVGAACHPDQTVAMYAVDSMRQLVGKLLSRSELAHFTHQGEALRPFVMVEKHCSSVAVRELTVQCVDQAMNTHSKRLGSGWAVGMELLVCAAEDPAPSVLRQVLDTVESVVRRHWGWWGKGYDVIAECITAAAAASRNPYHTDCSLDAIRLLRTCGEELARPVLADGGSPVTRASSAEMNGFPDDNVDSFSRSNSAPSPTLEPPTSPCPHPPQGFSNPSAAWKRLFAALVDVITHDSRRRCADLAAEVLFGFIDGGMSNGWGLDTWQAFFRDAVCGMFDMNEDRYSIPGGIDRLLSFSSKYLPNLWLVVSCQYAKIGPLLLPLCLDLFIGWMAQSLQTVAVEGVALLQSVIDCLALALDPAGWSVVVASLKEAWRRCVCYGYPREVPKEATADAQAPFMAWLEGPEGPMALPALRSRCHVLVLYQRLVHSVFQHHGHSLPPGLQLDLLDVLLESVQQATTANRDTVFLQLMGEYITMQGAKSLLSQMQLAGLSSDEELDDPGEEPVPGRMEDWHRAPGRGEIEQEMKADAAEGLGSPSEQAQEAATAVEDVAPGPIDAGGDRQADASNQEADAENGGPKADGSNREADAEADGLQASGSSQEANAEEGGPKVSGSNLNADAGADDRQADGGNQQADAEAGDPKADGSNQEADAKASDRRADGSNQEVDSGVGDRQADSSNQEAGARANDRLADAKYQQADAASNKETSGYTDGAQALSRDGGHEEHEAEAVRSPTAADQLHAPQPAAPEGSGAHGVVDDMEDEVPARDEVGPGPGVAPMKGPPQLGRRTISASRSDALQRAGPASGGITIQPMPDDSLGSSTTEGSSVTEGPASDDWWAGLPELCMRMPEGGESVFRGLLRLEAEGGTLAIRALQDCVMRRSKEDAEDSAAPAAEARLLALCQRLIMQAAKEAAHMRETLTPEDPESPPPPPKHQWEQAMRAPLVAKALETYRTVQSEQFLAQLKELFPELACLVCSRQMSIRRSLGALFSDQLPGFLFREDR
ncbi:unnamed protein product [Ostreobium quekettii]|uniref:SEC7 domain-containing protein n=1 Tax=Ostreobium quekettii TaxID=121088 RepID=A0A8S1J058_9CHLO|nr:unnamed protein product [Ostreobium quekettii]